MSTEREFQELNLKLSELKERRAVLVAQEEQKAEERVQLERELKEAGVNSDDPEGETARLEKEAEEAYQKAKKEVDDFEVELDALQIKTSTIEFN